MNNNFGNRLSQVSVYLHKLVPGHFPILGKVWVSQCTERQRQDVVIRYRLAEQQLVDAEHGVVRQNLLLVHIKQVKQN